MELVLGDVEDLLGGGDGVISRFETRALNIGGCAGARRLGNGFRSRTVLLWPESRQATSRGRVATFDKAGEFARREGSFHKTVAVLAPCSSDVPSAMK